VAFIAVLPPSLRSGGLDGRLPHGLDLDLDLDPLAHPHAAGLEDLVPGETEVLAVDGGLRREAGAQVAPGVPRLPGALDVEKDFARDAAGVGIGSATLYRKLKRYGERG